MTRRTIPVQATLTWPTGGMRTGRYALIKVTDPESNLTIVEFEFELEPEALAEFLSSLRTMRTIPATVLDPADHAHLGERRIQEVITTEDGYTHSPGYTLESAAEDEAHAAALRATGRWTRVWWDHNSRKGGWRLLGVRYEPLPEGEASPS